MGRDDPQFNLRLPYELKEKLKQRAKSNGRSPLMLLLLPHVMSPDMPYIQQKVVIGLF